MNIVLLIVLPLGGLIIGWFARLIVARYQLFSSEQQSLKLKKNAVAEAERAKKEILVEARNSILEERRQFERETREQRNEFQQYEKRLQQKEDNLTRETSSLADGFSDLSRRQGILDDKEERLNGEEMRWRAELERVSGLTAEEAKKILLQELENEAKHDAQVLINKIEQESRATAEKKARDILITTIQRLATEVTTEITVASVTLPNDEMKGRIIGREGRNIRTLETLTGVDITIDDTPEAVVISCFDPIRKAIAKNALEQLIADGRIHPARIEEVVEKVTKDIGQVIYEEGEKVLFDLGIHDMHPEGVQALGRLHFRNSYGQNVLAHSKEVAIIAGMIATEVGVDAVIAKRGALLHDIGKGLATDGEKSHVEIGGEFTRRIGEDPRVVNAVMAHHDDEEMISPEGVIIQLADAISAARPGARYESLDYYIKRLENLEKIAKEFSGVEKVFAIQAGRELRIMVNHDRVDDQKTQTMAKDIVKKIEEQLKFPGRIRVTIIRETRVVEYAR